MVAPSLSAVVECRGLTKVFQDFWLRPRVTAVSNLDLVAHPGEVLGLLGPNGAGKSTTIKLILGLLFPTRGRVAVFGRPPTDLAVKARLGYLPEESYLYRFLNARETLDYYGRLFGLPRRERQRRLEMLLDMVGLSGAQARPVGEYSKGMQRRIGLAQALINDPDLLILDEPTTGLDPLGTRQVKDLILHLRARGKTVLLCSHLLADVEDVCDRVTILYGGQVRATGTVSELLTVSGALLIETGTLRPETLAKVRQVIEAESGQPVRSVEKPRMKLEALFLDIVRRAQEQGTATSGAVGGGAVADFLTSGAAPQGRQVIEELLSGGAKPPAVPAAPAEPAAPAPPPPDRAVLEDLTQPAAPEKQATPSPAPAPPAGETPDRRVIDDLLGKGGSP